jgi:hypothetical protein
MNPCKNCEIGFGSNTTVTDELGEYIESISCEDTCEIRKKFLNTFCKNIYCEYIDEAKMRKLKDKGELI